MHQRFFFCFMVGLMINACGSKTSTTNCNNPPSFAQVQSDILNQATADNGRCLNCHSTNTRKTSPLLDTYDQVSSHANQSLSEIQSGDMPRQGTLSSAQKTLFQQWVECGKKQ